MSSEIAIAAEGLGKAYLIYKRPQDRLWQMIFRSRIFYDQYWAVQNLDLTVRKGETVAIIGRNGSGKSTLLQMISRTLTPNVGKLSVNGRVAPLLELGAGFNPEFTGRENVMLSGAILGMTPDQIKAREASILEFASIGDFIEQPVKTYSSGMFARLAFAVAAHADADILIVDEILAVGDAAFTQKCMRFIRSFKERGTLLFVSHDTGTVNSLCERAIWMDSGQVRADGPVRDVSFAYQVALNQEIDGRGFSISGRRRQAAAPREDVRHDVLKKSNRHNVIEIFSFDADAPAFGQGGGRIEDVRLIDPAGNPLLVIEGGEEVILEIACVANVALWQPIVGFLLKDRLGQNLFGDNTYLSYRDNPYPIKAGGRFKARFSFQMPYLPNGDYAVTAALADGTQSEHLQHHWVDEALMFRCESSHVASGLIGLPMHDIRLV